MDAIWQLTPHFLCSGSSVSAVEVSYWLRLSEAYDWDTHVHMMEFKNPLEGDETRELRPGGPVFRHVPAEVVPLTEDLQGILLHGSVHPHYEGERHSVGYIYPTKNPRFDIQSSALEWPWYTSFSAMVSNVVFWIPVERRVEAEPRARLAPARYVSGSGRTVTPVSELYVDDRVGAETFDLEEVYDVSAAAAEVDPAVGELHAGASGEADVVASAPAESQSIPPSGGAPPRQAAKTRR